MGNEHIAHIYDVIEDRDELFLVMEYVEGATLRQRLRTPLSIDQFLDLAVQCVEALVAAHASAHSIKLPRRSRPFE